MTQLLEGRLLPPFQPYDVALKSLRVDERQEPLLGYVLGRHVRGSASTSPTTPDAPQVDVHCPDWAAREFARRMHQPNACGSGQRLKRIVKP